MWNHNIFGSPSLFTPALGQINYTTVITKKQDNMTYVQEAIYIIFKTNQEYL